MMKRSRIRQRAPVGAKEGQRLRTAFGVAQRRLRELGEEWRATRLEIAELRRDIADQAKQIEALTSKIDSVTNREEELRAMLLGAHDQLMRRAEKIKADLMAELQRSAPQESAAASHRASEVPMAIRPEDQNRALGTRVDYEQLSRYFAYRRLVNRIREVANAVLPSDAIVVVVSKGDEELLELGPGRRGWHFPRNEAGAYAGYYPADDTEAIAHLEDLREKGAGFLLFPETAFWWLESYKEFGEHLNSRYRCVWDDEDYTIYELAEGGPAEDRHTP
jgi:hypothetical protein